jgi:lipoate synthase
MREVRRQLPDAKLEVLTPDFKGKQEEYSRVAAERPTFITTTSKPCRDFIQQRGAAPNMSARSSCCKT